jgi:hypothetical protein
MSRASVPGTAVASVRSSATVRSRPLGVARKPALSPDNELVHFDLRQCARPRACQPLQRSALTLSFVLIAVRRAMLANLAEGSGDPAAPRDGQLGGRGDDRRWCGTPVPGGGANRGWERRRR